MMKKYKLYFEDNGYPMISIPMTGNNETANVTKQDAKITTGNGWDWMSPVNKGMSMNADFARMHVIDNVLLPFDLNTVKLSLNGEIFSLWSFAWCYSCGSSCCTLRP